MSLMMKTVLIVYIMCMSYVIHVENSAIMDRIDFMEAINDNNERAQYGGQLFVQKRKDVHLVVRKPLNNNQHFIGRIIIPCKCSLVLWIGLFFDYCFWAFVLDCKYGCVIHYIIIIIITFRRNQIIANRQCWTMRNNPFTIKNWLEKQSISFWFP